MSIVPLIGIALLALKATKATQIGKYLQTQITVYKFDFNKGNPVMKFKVQMTNPVNGSIRINAITGSLNYKGYEVGQLSYVQPIDILPLSKQTIVVDATPNFMNIGLALANDPQNISREAVLKINIFTPLGILTEETKFSI